MIKAQKAPTFRSEPFAFARGSAAATAAAAAVVAVRSCVVAVAAVITLTATTVILLDKQEHKNKDKNPCAGIAAKKTFVIAAHIVLPPFSDFTIYYADFAASVKNQISEAWKSMDEIS